MSKYDTTPDKNIEEPEEGAECTTEDLSQAIAQSLCEQRHRERVEKLKSGELTVEDLDVIPFYDPKDWESKEQYAEIVGSKMNEILGKEVW